MIGYQQPDLSINWTVEHAMLVIGRARHFARAVAVHFVEYTAEFFSIHNDVLKSFSAQSILCLFLEFCHSFD